jgi:hypothetical protein
MSLAIFEVSTTSSLKSLTACAKRKILVALPEGVITILDRELVGKLGEGHSDTLRTIIMNWLSEKGYLAKGESCEKD